MFKYVLLCISLCLISCAKEAKQTSTTNNPNFNIELLFEFDGCKIYRFTDIGTKRYFTKCNNSSSISWQETCGKGCNRYLENKTGY